MNIQLSKGAQRAIELLLQAFDRADRAQGCKLLAELDAKLLYEAALTVVLRLLFLLWAEGRALLPASMSACALSALWSALRGAADAAEDGKTAPRDNASCGAWARLYATFRAVFAGSSDVSLGPANGGGQLFDPDRYPFLEGRPRADAPDGSQQEPLPISDQTVLALLESLLFADPGGKAKRQRQRVCFNALDVEELGHIYQTLLSHRDRRRSSTHYTPRPLTEPICAQTLEPLCYLGAAEGLPREQWQVRSEAELLALRVCDPACGSGAFLLQACRYLAARLLEAWGDERREREPEALRLVALRCVYGVDKDPLAVEMARLSLWLLSARRGETLSLFAQAIRCGDSLVGVPDLAQLPTFSQDARGLAAPVPFHWPLEFPQVFPQAESGRQGFDAIVSNPPFLGGLRISQELSDSYNLYLCRNRKEVSRKADLVAHFIWRMYELLRPLGILGFLSTKTAAEGLTRQAGLLRVLRQGGTIFRATSPFPWPGSAAVQAVIVHLCRGPWRGPITLDGRPCDSINDQLACTDASASAGQVHRLRENRGLCYEGSVILSTGFLVSPEQAQQWIAEDQRNREVLFPYVGGREFNQTPTFVPPRWAIRFGERTLAEARSYAQPFAHVLTHVHPERMCKNASKYPRMVQQWWKYWHERHVLYAAAARVSRVLVRSRVCARHMLGFVPADWVYGDAVIVFALDSYADFAILQSSIHEAWAAHYTSTMRIDLRYVQSSCFETFARPVATAALEAAGSALYRFRQALMRARGEGLTRTYHRFHNPTETATDIHTLRQLHCELDAAVSCAYGWLDLALHHGHGFHQTRHGVRYTLTEPARRAVLARLLELNHARQAAQPAEAHKPLF